jgi:hypothetical protein
MSVLWIFLARDLPEVLASQEASAGMHFLPGALDPRALRMSFEDVTAHSRDQWRRRVIEGYRNAADRFRNDPHGLFLTYRELPEAIWERAAPHFGIELPAAERDRMREAAKHDSK